MEIIVVQFIENVFACTWSKILERSKSKKYDLVWVKNLECSAAIFVAPHNNLAHLIALKKKKVKVLESQHNIQETVAFNWTHWMKVSNNNNYRNTSAISVVV